MDGAIRKLSFIVSKGSLDNVYPALILANGARAEGIDANVFFTFFGLDAIRRGRVERLKLATVGNPALHLPTVAGALPGVSAAMTRLLAGRLERSGIPAIPEFLELVADTGAGLYACKASADLFGLTKDDFVDRIGGIITVGEFYELAAGGQIVYT
ncbi:MAG TPA: DsrE/DsrF/DrsH-like family protein [Actinophytocola sp.]|jgi:peroxiredoxin family protein|nr:DsrE/DsrF/DrsH-like family protein [Actinophytocola sp.]